jgi:ubiquinone/menaquinone biosynthesis C-methylase UbiE
MDGDASMRDWYLRYYAAVASSRANSLYCERLFGRDMSQHGFAEVEHLDRMVDAARLGEGQQALDMGCGSGGIAAYFSEKSGAHFTGIDFIPEAIRQAAACAAGREQHLRFLVADIANLPFAPASFDVLTSVDSLYFTSPLETVGQMKILLKPGGRMVFFYSEGWEPWTPLEKFDFGALPAECTPLGLALRAHGLNFQTWDYTSSDYEHAQRKKAISEELKADFEFEDNLFLYENHHDEACGIMQAIEACAHVRYLYLASAD